MGALLAGCWPSGLAALLVGVAAGALVMAAAALAGREDDP